MATGPLHTDIACLVISSPATHVATSRPKPCLRRIIHSIWTFSTHPWHIATIRRWAGCRARFAAHDEAVCWRPRATRRANLGALCNVFDHGPGRSNLDGGAFYCYNDYIVCMIRMNWDRTDCSGHSLPRRQQGGGVGRKWAASGSRGIGANSTSKGNFSAGWPQKQPRKITDTTLCCGTRQRKAGAPSRI
jgi:hypothetical protein